jgi:hypothetical protein
VVILLPFFARGGGRLFKTRPHPIYLNPTPLACVSKRHNSSLNYN